MVHDARTCALLAALVFMVIEVSHAQQTPNRPRGVIEDYVLDSGKHDNHTGQFQVVFSRAIKVEDAVWLRLYFNQVSMPPASFIRVTSVFDGESQELDSDALSMWSDTTAYFNGDTLIVELVAAPQTSGNRFVVGRIGVQRFGDLEGVPGNCGICRRDKRVPSAEDWSCRLMPVGCTASVYNTQSCMVSAGHCMEGDLVAQFRVPPSDNNCGPDNPGVAEQFPITARQFVDGGVGNDWAVMTSGVNNLGQKAFQRYNVRRPLAMVLPKKGRSTINGYGVDGTCVRSQTQQFSRGRIKSQQAQFYTYSNDIRSGNSGSGFLVNGEIVGVVSHCDNQGGCENFATRIDLPAFVNARNALCPE